MTRRQFTHAILAVSRTRPLMRSAQDQHLQLWKRDSIQWQPDDPPGSRYAVLAGDRSRACSMFTYAFELPGRVWAPAHYHSQDAHVCVIEGTLLIGLGTTSDRS